MSQSSIFLGKARCEASRWCEGETTGNQSALDQLVRRPKCVIWIMTAVPCSWQASVRSFIQGTTSSR